MSTNMLITTRLRSLSNPPLSIWKGYPLSTSHQSWERCRCICYLPQDDTQRAPWNSCSACVGYNLDPAFCIMCSAVMLTSCKWTGGTGTGDTHDVHHGHKCSLEGASFAKRYILTHTCPCLGNRYLWSSHNLTLVGLILSWISRGHRINPSCFQWILILLIQSF